MMRASKIQNDQGLETEFAGLLVIVVIALVGVFVGLYLGLLYCGVSGI
jgi:hypothetical protein